MRIVMCPLVSRDMPRAIRCVRSCQHQFPTKTLDVDIVVIINSLDNHFVHSFAEWCEFNDVKYKITRSNGTAPRGKNSILDFFLNSDYDGCSILDGDDVWYPTSMQQIERHLVRHPGTDILIVKPGDTVVNRELEHYLHIKDDLWGLLWGNNIFSLKYIYGPGPHAMFSEGHWACRNLGGHIFYSRKLATRMRYDEEQLLGEDLLSEFEMLKLHQEGEITFWCSFASDVQILDRSMNDNIQSKLADKEQFYYTRIIEKVREILPVDRSSFHELPVEFPPMLFSYQQKVEFIREFF